MTLKLNTNIIDVLKVYATLMVFICHSTIIAHQEFGFELQGVWRALNTPAWGGVWMFFTLGGFLAAYGFDQQKYTLDKTGIIRYYKGRFIKVLLPTWIFISLMYIAQMNEANVSFITIVQFLTCTFNGSGAGIKLVGASWYVFITMWLYLLAPWLYKGIMHLENRQKGQEIRSFIILLSLVCLVGLAYRFIGYRLFRLDYYTWMYANVLGSIDLFIIGMIGCRLVHYLPTAINPQRLQFAKVTWIIVLIVISTIFSGWIYELQIDNALFSYLQSKVNKIYYYLGPYLFSLEAMLAVCLFSYNVENERITPPWKDYAKRYPSLHLCFTYGIVYYLLL